MALSKNELIASIVAAATHETDESRHTVTIEDCTMTTFLEKPDHSGTWSLWSSFRFSMVDAQLVNVMPEGKEAQYFFYLPYPELGENHGSATLIFFMKDGAVARHEKPRSRDIRKEARPSPRGDGTTHYYDTSEKFRFEMDGENTKAKARQFADGYRLYIREHCALSG